MQTTLASAAFAVPTNWLRPGVFTLLPFLAIAAREVQGMFRLRELNLLGYRQVALAGDDSASQNLRAADGVGFAYLARKSELWHLNQRHMCCWRCTVPRCLQRSRRLLAS